jgi:hypothetical protein
MKKLANVRATLVTAPAGLSISLAMIAATPPAHAQTTEVAPVAIEAEGAPYDLRHRRPGATPLEVESVGARQVVGHVEGMAVGGRGALIPGHRTLCFTPCTLYVEPGLFELYAERPGQIPSITYVDVPSQGLRVRLHTPSLGGVLGGALLGTFGSIGLMVSGVALGVGLPSDQSTVTAAGAAGLAGSAALAIGGFTWLALSARVGIAESGPPRRASLSFGAVPARGGAQFTAAVRF